MGSFHSKTAPASTQTNPESTHKVQGKGILNRYGSADGSGSTNVASPHIASVDGVMGKLLTETPVHVLKIGLANDIGVSFSLQGDLQTHIISGLSASLQVRQDFIILGMD